MGGGGPKRSGELKHRCTLRSRGSGRPLGQQPRAGKARTAALPRPPHHTASPSPTARMLLQTPLTPLNDLTWVQTPPPPLPRCANQGRSPTLPEPQLHRRGTHHVRRCRPSNARKAGTGKPRPRSQAPGERSPPSGPLGCPWTTHATDACPPSANPTHGTQTDHSAAALWHFRSAPKAFRSPAYGHPAVPTSSAPWRSYGA